MLRNIILMDAMNEWNAKLNTKRFYFIQVQNVPFEALPSIGTSDISSSF
jgi:hypothetical protein